MAIDPKILDLIVFMRLTDPAFQQIDKERNERLQQMMERKDRYGY